MVAPPSEVRSTRVESSGAGFFAGVLGAAATTPATGFWVAGTEECALGAPTDTAAVPPEAADGVFGFPMGAEVPVVAMEPAVGLEALVVFAALIGDAVGRGVPMLELPVTAPGG